LVSLLKFYFESIVQCNNTKLILCKKYFPCVLFAAKYEVQCYKQNVVEDKIKCALCNLKTKVRNENKVRIVNNKVGSITLFQFNYNYAFNVVNYIAIIIILCWKHQIPVTITITFTLGIGYKLN